MFHKENRMQEIDATLAPYATKHSEAVRDSQEITPRFLLPFDSDVTKITDSFAFRALARKTQSFFSPKMDVITTRNTHSISGVEDHAYYVGGPMALNLNVSLLRAIARGHDRGHTPFGHAGEKALHSMTAFRHEEQSYRIATALNNENLCVQTLDGIRNHSSGDGFTGIAKDTHMTHEGALIELMDKTSEMISGLRDLLHYDVITPEEIPETSLYRLGITHEMLVQNPDSAFDIMKFRFLDSIIEASRDIDKAMTKRIHMGENERIAILELKKFRSSLRKTKPKMQERDEYAARATELVINYFRANPDELLKSELHYHMHQRNPQHYEEVYCRTATLERKIADVFSSLSDSAVIDMCREIDRVAARDIFKNLLGTSGPVKQFSVKRTLASGKDISTILIPKNQPGNTPTIPKK